MAFLISAGLRDDSIAFSPPDRFFALHGCNNSKAAAQNCVSIAPPLREGECPGSQLQSDNQIAIHARKNPPAPTVSSPLAV